MQQNPPLALMALTTYNQEPFVREAVRSVLGQDYSPLEIIISDDCSRDATWEIIQEEVASYRAGGGHHHIILNRNKQNLGIVKHNQVLQPLIHGDIVIACAGDDISYPSRVSKIVEAWVANGSKATILHHGYEEIDLNGNVVRTVTTPRSAESALGATAAYAVRVFKEFPPLGESVTIEDQAWAKRALMLGPELRIPDILVKYRVGCGVSTKFANDRERMYKNAITMMQSCEQVLKDLEVMRPRIEPERYDLVYEMALRLREEADVDWRIVSDLPTAQRYRAVLEKRRQGRLGRNVVHFYVQGLTYLQPWLVGSAQRQVYSWLSRLAHGAVSFGRSISKVNDTV